MASQPYQYMPLSTQGNPIRLLTLWPGKWDDEILCTIHHADLDNKLAYRALSYTWGDANDTREILLQNRPFPVTKNLEIALRHLRLMYCANHPSIFWVDALTINQRDLQERGSQVRKMRYIFTRAQQVVAWTGEADIETEVLFDLFDEISRVSESSIATFLSTTLLSDVVLDGRPFDAASKNWTPLIRFLSRPYFTRLWVLSELSARFRHETISATREHPCVMVCGSRTVSTITFYVTFLMMTLWAYDSAESLAKYSVAEGLSMVFCINRILLAGQMLSDIALSSLNLKASDPRDRVYALLALNRTEGKDFPVDYAKSADQVYEDFVIFCLSRERSLNILEGDPFPYLGSDDHPSWLHQFKSSSFVSTIAHDKDDPGAGLTMHMLFEGQSKLLSLEGVLIGPVRKALGPFFVDEVEETRSQAERRITSTLDWRNDTLETTRQQLTTLAADLTKQRQDDLCRALIGDYEFGGGRPPASPISDATFQEIRAWLHLSHREGSCKKAIRTGLSERTEGLLLNYVRMRNIFVLDSGHVCVGTQNTREGDSVAMLYGGRQCFVLRPQGSNYRLQGGAYVQGAMKGEFIKERGEDGKPKSSRMFTIS